ncbi:hypothetical protein [Campylobacter sp. MG1]|uniref:hypothetical protein n=1 Tax=Campylobacter sp. MG1 TaxID=2976332 RepID=UPI00226D2282|nr:hypothetical protein [Campylobacter sp. MG1]
MGLLYKKCDICGNKIDKLQCLVYGGFINLIKCKKCKTEYIIIETWFYRVINNISTSVVSFLSLFFALVAGFYIDKIFTGLSGIYVFILVILLTLLFMFFVATFLQALFMLLFIVKFEIKKDIVENKKIKNIFSKFFNRN